MDELQGLLRRYALGVWRRRWIAMLAAWALCLGGWAAVFSIPNQFEANARMYVDADAVLTPLLRGLALDNSPSNQLEVLERTLLSRPNLEKLISKTDLGLSVGGTSDLQNLVASLATAIKITPQTRNLFTIGYRNTRPRLAYDVVQTVLTIFVESKAGNNRTDMANARVFLDQQINQYEQKLRQAEAQRAAFHSKYLDLLPDSTGGASRLDSARTTVAAMQDQLKQVRLRMALAEQQLATTPPTISADSEQAIALSGGGETSELGRAQMLLDQLRLRYTDQHPEVIRQQALVAQLKASGGGAVARSGGGGRGRSLSNPIYEKLKLQVFDFQAAVASLTQQITDKQAEAERLGAIARGAPGLLAQYTDMDRDYTVLERNYQELIQRREEMRLAAAADTDAEKVKLQVIDPPQVPHTPVAPNRVALVSGVLALGLAGGIGLAVLLLQFDTSFHSLDELRKLELPVIGGISLIAASVPLRRRVFTAAGFGVAVLLLVAAYGGLLLHLLHRGVA